MVTTRRYREDYGAAYAGLQDLPQEVLELVLLHLQDSRAMAVVRVVCKSLALAGKAAVRRACKRDLTARGLQRYLPQFNCLVELQLSSPLSARHASLLVQLTSLNLQGSRYQQECSALASLTRVAELRAACGLQNTEDLTALMQLTRLVYKSSDRKSEPIQSDPLAQLRHLELMNLDVSQIASLSLAAQSSGLTGLTALSFHCAPSNLCPTGDATTARVITAPAPHLRELHLDFFTAPIKVPSLSSCANFGAHLTSLTLRGGPPHPLDQELAWCFFSDSQDLAGLTQLLAALPQLANILENGVRVLEERGDTSALYASARWGIKWHSSTAGRGWHANRKRGPCYLGCDDSQSW
ncbi:hypothetical protein WJX73_010209 [Symbiochloris irregularis]|uniref:F-box domain-containing protein n=1 Tax=Symbiochloris irregularis TaxID=706552 RepID=A0AAW1NLZ1_9CHLO